MCPNVSGKKIASKLAAKFQANKVFLFQRVGLTANQPGGDFGCFSAGRQ
jgi:acetylglutamate kinase